MTPASLIPILLAAIVRSVPAPEPVILPEVTPPPAVRVAIPLEPTPASIGQAHGESASDSGDSDSSLPDGNDSDEVAHASESGHFSHAVLSSPEGIELGCPEGEAFPDPLTAGTLDGVPFLLLRPPTR